MISVTSGWVESAQPVVSRVVSFSRKELPQIQSRETSSGNPKGQGNNRKCLKRNFFERFEEKKAYKRETVSLSIYGGACKILNVKKISSFDKVLFILN